MPLTPLIIIFLLLSMLIILLTIFYILYSLYIRFLYDNVPIKMYQDFNIMKNLTPEERELLILLAYKKVDGEIYCFTKYLRMIKISDITNLLTFGVSLILSIITANFNSALGILTIILIPLATSIPVVYKAFIHRSLEYKNIQN